MNILPLGIRTLRVIGNQSVLPKGLELLTNMTLLISESSWDNVWPGWEGKKITKQVTGLDNGQWLRQSQEEVGPPPWASWEKQGRAHKDVRVIFSPGNTPEPPGRYPRTA